MAEDKKIQGRKRPISNFKIPESPKTFPQDYLDFGYMHIMRNAHFSPKKAQRTFHIQKIALRLRIIISEFPMKICEFVQIIVQNFHFSTTMTHITIP